MPKSRFIKSTERGNTIQRYCGNHGTLMREAIKSNWGFGWTVFTYRYKRGIDGTYTNEEFKEIKEKYFSR